MLVTIKSSTEISYLFTHGKRLHTPYISFIVLPTKQPHDQHGRVAFVAGKKLGNAVWRNRAKRRMRYLCRDIDGPWIGYDVVFLAKKQTATVSYQLLREACSKLLSETSL